MIVEFSVGNFRSIDKIVTLSFVSTGLKSPEKFLFVDENNITDSKKNLSFFNTLGIYGANGSGKSNIIKALDNFIKVIVSQPSDLSSLESLCQPFLYQKDAEKTESFFQIVMIINNIKYRYGLTVKKNLERDSSDNENSREIVTNEWLYADKSKNMSHLFVRVNDKLEKNNLPNKTSIPKAIPYKHTLFLTHAAAFDTNGDCKIISDYLRAYVTSNFEINHDKFRWMAMRYVKEDFNNTKTEFLNLLSSFNLKYDDIELDNDEEIKYDKIFPQEKISFSKSFKIDNEKKIIHLNLKDNESSGTQKMFDLAGLLLLTFSFDKPAFIILDEIDSHFHPSLLIKLISLFNNPNINKSKSQLLFTSHDTNLMSPSIMRRDQFYFTEKREDNSTRLYSLSDLKGIRNDADFAKQYLAGYYGALPVLKDYCEKINSEDNG